MSSCPNGQGESQRFSPQAAELEFFEVQTLSRCLPGWPSLRCRAHDAVKTPRAPKPLGSLPCVSSEISAGEASFAGEAVLGPRAGPTYPCTCVSGAALARAWRWHRNRSRVQKPMLLCSLPGSWVAHGFPAVPPLRRIFSSKHCTLKRNNQNIPLMP